MDPLSNPSNPYKNYIVIAIFLSLAIVASIIYLLTTGNRGDRKEALIIPTPTPAKILESAYNPPSVTPAPSLHWSIFESARYGYLLKYPNDWTATISTQQDPKILEYVIFNPLTATKAGELSITLTYTTRSYKEVLDSDPQPGEAIIVSSISATRKLKQDSQRNISISVALPHNSNTFVLLAKEKYKDIFNQMLSTLNLAP